MLSVSSGGSFNNTNNFLNRILKGDIYPNLESYAQRGVDALRSATPIDSGLTAESWSYEIQESGSQVTIWWTNTNVVNGFHVAIGLQYGHGTGKGGWVQGYDYINPSLKEVFDKLADDVWKEVQKA